jgi:hypothetical protein
VWTHRRAQPQPLTRTAWNRRRCPGVFETLTLILRKSRARRRAHDIAPRSQTLLIALRAVLRLRVVELVISPIIAAVVIVFVEKSHHVDDGLWVLLLFLLRDPVGLEGPLPLFR